VSSTLAPVTIGAGVSFGDATRLWWRVGWLSFGGPTAQIALMHRLLVDERRWLDEREFLDALGFCMLLPGPEAMQLATYAGWKLHGVRGGLVAGTLFVLPGAFVVLALSITYALLGSLPAVQAAFLGIQAAVLALVVQAMLKLSRRALTTPAQPWVALAAFVALFLFSVPFPIVVLAALVLGWLWPGVRGSVAHAPHAAAVATPVSLVSTLRTVLLWTAIWVLPLLSIAGLFGPSHLLSQLAWFFSRLSVITFGGAYAVLAWMSQDVVMNHHWLSARQMIDGLGLAETTPGPLILVTEFVGFMAAFRAHPGASLAYGFAGAAIAVWATFVPCMLWIFAGAPYVARLREHPRLQSGLHVLTAAVLGVIANLALWFALHVLFGSVATRSAGFAHVLVPDVRTLHGSALGLAILAGVLLWRGWSVHRMLALCAALAWLASAVGR
jgi:chromate transporter